MNQPDILLYGGSSTLDYHLLKNNDIFKVEAQDYHRLQIEAYLVNLIEKIKPETVIDIGVTVPRNYGTKYITYGDQSNSNVVGDLCDSVEGNIKHVRKSVSDFNEEVDLVICTEVLEHVYNPFKAVEHIASWLDKGKYLFISTPFFWPWHGTENYKDYWRFTHQGLELLCKDFSDVDIYPLAFTDEGSQLYNILRKFECMGHAELTEATTGYVVIAKK